MKKLSFVQRTDARHWVGDGFPVRTIFSYTDRSESFSPFLHLDYAGPAEFPPTDKRLGVGEHPHRGFETVTIVYAGEIAHRDSSGGGGLIGPGDVQWMTAAGGVVHEEFHGPAFARSGGTFEAIQLWVNLPAKDKMKPGGYQAISSQQIPVVDIPEGAGTVRVIAGSYRDAKGPARTFTPINLWDARLKEGAQVSFNVPRRHTTALFVLNGRLRVAGSDVGPAEVVVLERDGEEVGIEALDGSTLLFLGGEPIREPVVGHGPFVMNTQEEIRQAVIDYQTGRMGRLRESA